MKRTLFFTLLLAGLAAAVQAQTFSQLCSSGQKLIYQIQDDRKSVALVGIVMEEYPDDDYPGDLAIPEKVTYKGQSYSVTAIGKRTFVGYSGVIQTVAIPNTVTFIDESAFGDGGETGIYDVTVAKDNPVYQVEGEENESMAVTKLIDKRTNQILWFTVEEFTYSSDPEVEVEIEVEEEPVIRIPTVRTEYPGGMAALKEYLATATQYPQEAQEKGQQGVVLLEFVVEKDGRISDVTVLRSVCPSIDEEAIRVVRAMPKWKPGENNGQPCRSYFQLPLTFSLQ